MSSLSKAPERILVITHGGLGDILLTTPLMTALKRAWPTALLDVYLLPGGDAMLAGNPDVHAVHQPRRRHGASSYLEFMKRHAGRYDLAVSTRPSDRQVLFARAAGRRAVSLVPARGQNRWWKEQLLTASARQDRNTHTVFDILQLADVLGIPRVLECRPPRDPEAARRLADRTGFEPASERFAVLQVSPRFRYKAWTDTGWRAVARYLGERGHRVVLVGGPSAEDRRAAEELLDAAPPGATNLVGCVSLAEVAALLSSAAVYLGPDTGTTHLASVCGAPTVALFGRVFSHYLPYHAGLEAHPYRPDGPGRLLSRHVRVVLGRCDCRTGEAACTARVNDPAPCMLNLPPDEVIETMDSLLDNSSMPSGTEACKVEGP